MSLPGLRIRPTAPPTYTSPLSPQPNQYIVTTSAALPLLLGRKFSTLQLLGSCCVSQSIPLSSSAWCPVTEDAETTKYQLSVVPVPT